MEGGSDIEALPPGFEPLNDDIPGVEIAHQENGENGEKEQVEDEENPFADDDDSDDEGGQIQVTIRKEEIAKPSHSSHGKLDIDLTPLINDKPIYDIDLAQMEDRPWRKPGADITDYFNYGFTEDTWNLYCERQKKLRAEFAGNQTAANKSLFSSIQLQNPLAHPIIQQSNNTSVVKVLTDNGGRFKANQYHTNILNSIPSEPIMRTVIGGNVSAQSSTPIANPPIVDFSKPPPGISLPPVVGATTNTPSAITQSEAPPGISAEEKPPGVSSPSSASLSSSNPPGIPAVALPGLDLNLGIPPPGFNPMMPPPGIPPSMGMLSNVPPPGFSMPPPQFSRAGFTQNAPGQMSQPRTGYEEEDDRRSRRKRSRSRSPSKKDRETRRRTDRDRGSDRTSSRRHRSRSQSKDRKRDREDRDREKRRERRDDEERSKKSSRSRRGDDDDDRRDRKEKRSRHPEESHSYVEGKSDPLDEQEEYPQQD